MSRSMFSALLLTFFALLGSGCTENKLPGPQPSANAPYEGEVEDIKAHVLISLKEPSGTETILYGTYPASCSPAPWDEGVSGAFRASFDGYELDVEENPDPGVLTLSYARGITLHTPTGMRYGKIWDSSTYFSKDEHGILVRARLESQYSQGSSLDLEARFTCT